MCAKKLEIGQKDEPAHAFQFVDANVLSYLIGSPSGTLYQWRDDEIFHKVGFIYRGSVRKYSFDDAAKLTYPKLSDYEIAKLRVEINAIMIRERKQTSAEKSRSRENVR